MMAIIIVLQSWAWKSCSYTKRKCQRSSISSGKQTGFEMYARSEKVFFDRTKHIPTKKHFKRSLYPIITAQATHNETNNFCSPVLISIGICSEYDARNVSTGSSLR